MFFGTRVRWWLMALEISVASGATSARAQSSYRNLDAGFPVRVEDATATERYSLDLDFLNLRYDELSNLRTRFQYEPQVSYGILPRTEAWVRLPIFYRERDAAPRAGVAGVGAGAMYQFNLETQHLPSFALGSEVFLPTGPHALPASFSLRGMATRSFSPGRVHLNGSIATYSVRAGPTLIITCPPQPVPGFPCGGSPLPPLDGPCAIGPGAGLAAAFSCAAQPAELPQRSAVLAAPGDIEKHNHWFLGMGMDKAFPLSSTLLLADFFAEKFEGIGRETDLTAEVGARHQLTPQAVIGGALGRHFRGAGFSTFITLGMTISHALQL
ncbi:MAG TPA: hypothetical protein VIH53_08680 [Gemmatimonadaceae bacterium]